MDRNLPTGYLLTRLGRPFMIGGLALTQRENG